MPDEASDVQQAATDTLFDFTLPARAGDQAPAQGCRTDDLLDELVGGAAVHAATGGLDAPLEQGADSPEAETNGAQHAPEAGPASPVEMETVAHLLGEIDGLLAPDPDAPPVLPDEDLPTIRTGLPRPPEPAAPPSPQAGHSGLAPQPPSHTPAVAPARPSAVTAKPPQKATPSPPWSQVIDPPAGGSPPLHQAQGFEEEIAQFYDEVHRLLSTRREITGHALALLDEARTILLTQPERRVRAEYNIRQVRSILERARESRRQSARYAFKVTFCLAFWLTLVAVGVSGLLRYQPQVALILTLLLGGGETLLSHAQPFLWALLAGAGGGVLSALADLVTHIRSRQDFDRQVALRFYVQPVMGVVLGAGIYLLLAFLFALMGQDLTARFVTRPLPAFAALCAGLWQQWVYAALYRLLGLFALRSRRR